MLDIERAIDDFDNFHTNLCSDLQESWQRIKTALAEGQKPLINSRVMQCCCTVLYVTDPDGNRLLRINTDCPVHRAA